MDVVVPKGTNTPPIHPPTTNSDVSTTKSMVKNNTSEFISLAAAPLYVSR
jgi:hypothetical protein